jgi:hypothetical protein
VEHDRISGGLQLATFIFVDHGNATRLGQIRDKHCQRFTLTMLSHAEPFHGPIARPIDQQLVAA